jgi:4-hydroxybenzoate polyprenyltransferase
LTIDLFTWWAISISWSIAFLIVAGLYLYTSSRPKRKQNVWVENREQLIEVGTYTVLVAISIIGAFTQTSWWLLPGCIFFSLAVLEAIEWQREESHRTQFRAKAKSVSKNFVFVWTLLGLLVFYIFSVKLGTGRLSELVFALGNIVVEVLLILYLFKNKDKTRSSR